MICRRQLPYSEFPLVGNPLPPLKNLACPPHKLACTLLFWPKITVFLCSFSSWSKCCSHQQGFPYCGRWEETPHQPEICSSPTWKNPPSRLYHSVHPLSDRGLSLLPNFQKEGLERISIPKGGYWKRGGDLFQRVAVFM